MPDKSASTLVPVIDRLHESGDRPALIRIDPDGTNSLSFSTLSRRVHAGARKLAQRHSAGERVVLYADSDEHWIVTALAAIRAGLIVVPIDAQTGVKTLASILEDCEAAVVFSDEEHASAVEEAGFGDRITDITEFDSEPEDGSDSSVNLPESDPDDIAIQFYTSGTTGAPKGVPLSHRNLAFQVSALDQAGLVRDDDRLLLPLPFHHVYPLVVGLITPLALGLTVVLPSAVTGPELIRAMRNGEVTFLIGVPRLYEALYRGIDGRIASAPAIARMLTRALLGLSGSIRYWTGLRAGRVLLRPMHRALGPHLRVLASGGAPLDPALANRLVALGWDIGIGYGLTETSPLLTLKPPGGRDLHSVGRPVPGIEIRLEPLADRSGDDEADPVQSSDGEVLARGPGVFGGYYRQPDRTAEVFTDDGWYRTGDLGHFDRRGNLCIAGRVSSMIVTGAGKNIYPEDLEAIYAAHPMIGEIGILAHDGGLGAVVVPDREQVTREGVSPDAAVSRALSEQAASLPTWQRIGRHVISRQPLERTRLGKLRRHLLDERFKELREGRGESRAKPVPVSELSGEDRSLVEQHAGGEVWKILCQRFSDQPLSPDSSLRMDLGLDSLGWLDLSMEIARATGVELDEQQIGMIESVRDLLKTASDADPVESAEATGSLREHPERFLSAEQQRWLKPLGPFQQRLARVLGRGIAAFVRWWWRLEVQGAANVPRDRACVITPNHVSYLDPFVIGSSLDPDTLARTSWGGWTGVAFRNALFRWGSRLARVVPVDPDRSAVSSLAFAFAALGQGMNLVWFPEGQRSASGDLLDFRPGIGWLLEDGELTVVPAWIDGAYEAWPPGQRLPRRGHVRVRFGQPVTAAELLERGEGPDQRAKLTDGLHRTVAELGGQSADDSVDADDS